jgi:N-acetylmuramoyl-L-alanine amidase
MTRHRCDLASAIHGSIFHELPQEDRGVKRARFAVLRHAHLPSVLIESGFLSSPQQSRLVGSPVWREHLARAIVAGVDRYRKWGAVSP